MKLTRLRRKILVCLESRDAVHSHAIGALIGGTALVSGGRKAYDALVRMEPHGWVERRTPQNGKWVHWRLTDAGRAALREDRS